VNAGYDGNVVLHGISFTAKESAIYVVLGPNGAGKTTLFRTVAGVLEPYSGEVLLDGRNMILSTEARSKINYLSHHYAMPDEMSVYDALAFWAEMEGAGGNGNVERVTEWFDLHDLEEKKFTDLSQGQKKRTSIAAVFLRDADLYLLDEPTSNLDPVFSKEIREILLRISQEKIVLYSSHNLYEASDIGTDLILIKGGSIAYFDKISNIKPKEYRYGFKASADISKIIEAKKEGDYYILTVSDSNEAAKTLKKLIENGILVYEMRQLDNPLQELFDRKEHSQ
jgi:ABC-2 type transport system ATP-binding protein